MTLTTWSDCLDGSSVSFAVYTTGVHSYPRPPVSFPAASQVIWAWINNTVTVKPQPKLSDGWDSGAVPAAVRLPRPGYRAAGR